MFECVFDITGANLPGDLEGIAAELDLMGVDAIVDGYGFITAICDGRSPEYLASVGCRPVTTMDKRW